MNRTANRTAYRAFQALVSTVALSSLLACGSAQFSAGGSGPGRPSPRTAGPSPAPSSNSEDAKSLASPGIQTDNTTTTNATPTPGVNPSIPPLVCPPAAQTVLILDFKSGWWAGDGGNFFQTLLKGLSDPCVSSVAFEYHHIITTGNTVQLIPGDAGPHDLATTSADNAALQSDWSHYTQIWLLSGSVSDNEDIRTDSPLFMGIIKKIQASGAHLMIASGNGNITHANTFLTTIGSTGRFATALQEGPVVDATGTFQVKSRLMLGKALQNHDLFDHGVQSIADDVDAIKVGLLVTHTSSMHSDYLVVDNADFTVVGDNTAGQPSIAVTIDRVAGVRMVLESGLQRFYAISADPADQTRIYLQNILLYLAKP